MPLITCDSRHPPRQRDLSGEDLGVLIAANGTFQVRARCYECRRWSSGAIAHAYIRSLGINPLQDLPVIRDHRGYLAICAVIGCGSDDVELNHFAPRAIFGKDADDWPTAFLCRRHHREWGQRVTPSLNPPPRLRTTGV